MRRKKEDYFVIALGVILVIIVSIIAVIASTDESSPDKNPPEVTSATTPAADSTIIPTQDITNTRPPLLYDEKSDEKLLDLIRNRRAISNADLLAKSKILTLLPQGKVSGVIHETRNIRIDYTQSADLFQVEIITTDITEAKDEANTWFKEQGFSQEGICSLPVGYYVSYVVADQIRDSGIVVDSLGNSCK
jgi:hypothetical protein